MHGDRSARMQSLNWYLRRFQAMSLREIVWRTSSAARDACDRYRLTDRSRRAARDAATALGNGTLLYPMISADARPRLRNLLDAEQQARLVKRAEAAARGELELLGGATVSCGRPLIWNRDPKHNVAGPMKYAPDIDYRDFRVVGDCKWVWEPARCHQWVVLGRAYRLTDQARFAVAVAEQWQGWMEQCPYGRGMHWRSPLELGVRLINWTWAYALVAPSDAITDQLRLRIWQSVALHLQDVDRKYSRGSSANNHLVGEAAGVLIASAAFASLPGAAAYFERAAQILREEIETQILPDGANAERATGYHTFVLQFFLLAGLAARAVGRDLGGRYWDRVQAQFEYLAALAEGGESIPAFNDADDGYVLDLHENPRSYQSWLSVGAALFGEELATAGQPAALEPVFWLLDATSPERGATDRGNLPLHERARANAPRAGTEARATRTLSSRAFNDAGVYLLQCGGVNFNGDDRIDDRISAAIDCGPLGFGSIAAHGHADALSFTLRCGGVEVLSDSGTYDYFTYPEWRNYLRSTAAHNTVCVDDKNQSELLGLFLWGSRAQARCEQWTPAADGGRLVGSHDGYMRLSSPVTHNRTFELRATERVLYIEDEFVSVGEAAGEHEIAQHWHLSEFAAVQRADSTSVTLDLPSGTITMEWDPALTMQVIEASEKSFPGWISRGYHRKTAATSLIARARIRGRARFLTRIAFSPVNHLVDADVVSRTPTTLTAGHTQ